MKIHFNDACERLKDGEVVAIPTETVYGLAASLNAPRAIEEIFLLKRRPADNPLIIHLAEAKDLFTYAVNLPENSELLLGQFWPGPLTIVAEADGEKVPATVRANLTTAAFRVPSHPITRQLVGQVGPLVAPSANLSGFPSATRPEHIEEDFGDDFPILDGGECSFGVESTILVNDSDSVWKIARQGVLSANAFYDVLGYLPPLLGFDQERGVLCPGRFHRHYAPKASLMLGHQGYQGQLDVVIGFSDRHYPGANTVYHLGPSQAPEVVCQKLYDTLRRIDKDGHSHAFVDMDFEKEGLWSTISERLHRAAEEV